MRPKATRRTASQLPSFGLTAWVLVERLVSDFESRHRSVDSAETDNYSLVIDVFRMANSTQNGLGRISG
jgi:hypothetical protein